MPSTNTYITVGNSLLKYDGSYLFLCQPGSTVSFGDGYTYKIVTIGTQTWLAENLMMDIPTYSQLISPADETNGIGRMYQQAAVPAINSAVAPYGWRVASQADVNVLRAQVIAYGGNMPLSLKSTSWDGTDDYGFDIVKSHFIIPTTDIVETNFWLSDENTRFYVRDGASYGYEQRSPTEWNNIRLILDN